MRFILNSKYLNTIKLGTNCSLNTLVLTMFGIHGSWFMSGTLFSTMIVETENLDFISESIIGQFLNLLLQITHFERIPANFKNFFLKHWQCFRYSMKRNWKNDMLSINSIDGLVYSNVVALRQCAGSLSIWYPSTVTFYSDCYWTSPTPIWPTCSSTCMDKTIYEISY